MVGTYPFVFDASLLARHAQPAAAGQHPRRASPARPARGVSRTARPDGAPERRRRRPPAPPRRTRAAGSPPRRGPRRGRGRRAARGRASAGALALAPVLALAPAAASAKGFDARPPADGLVAGVGAVLRPLLLAGDSEALHVLAFGIGSRPREILKSPDWLNEVDQALR